MTDFLERVAAERRADVASETRGGDDEFALRAKAIRWHRDLALRLQTGARHLQVIAEIKRVSPSAGTLNAHIDPAEQARRYVAAGASAISVLVEPRHWGGSLADLEAVRAAVEVPILAKDILVDERQLLVARAAGADMVLLIAELLDDDELRRFVQIARNLGMEALVEAHEPVAFGRGVCSGARLIGVNGRNLRMPSDIDAGRVRQLHSFVMPTQVLVAESGIASVDDARMLPARVDAVLVGTALMRADDPAPLIHGIASIKRTVPA
jgi:indole-3-glycerol phosphate synthase